MKVGIRKPSIKKSFKARTTGRAKRTLKKSINPLYGKKGMGYIKNPSKALKNKVYHKTTISATDAAKKTGGIFTGSFKFVWQIMKLIWYVSAIFVYGIYALLIFSLLRLYESKTNKVITSNNICHFLFRNLLYKIMTTFHLLNNNFAKWLFDMDYLVAA